MSETPGLEVEGLSVSFGGIDAVNNLSLAASLGTITGLIGPNGAGKTTTFNACSGVLRPQAGQVRVLGRDVTHHGVSGRARLGLGRTFQRMELFGSMTVRENVALGREAAYAGRRPLRLVFERRAERVDTAEATAEALARCGIERLAAQPIGSLSTGQRRLVELARVSAGRFQVLLLDEPSSGLDEAETERFASVLVDLVRERGLCILLVEHDMDLVLGVASLIHVLEFGERIFSGTPRQVRSSAVVRQAYLGDELSEAGP